MRAPPASTAWRSGCCALSLALGCARPAPPPPVQVAPSDARIRYTGRFEHTAGAVRFGWPASAIELAFRGSSLRARLQDVPVEDQTRDTDWISVVIDGGQPKTFALAEGLHLYPLARGLGPGTHRAAIYKRTEGQVGVIALRGFVLDPGASLRPPPTAPSRRIELVGDSVTAGYGDEGSAPSCQFSPRTENSLRSFGVYAARELGAAAVMIAWSGKGVTRNYDPRDALPLPAVYPRVLPEEPRLQPDAEAVPADVVVLNLGTNDFFAGVPDAQRFVSSYLAFVARLRARHPHALLVLVLGPMLADDFPQPQARSTLRRWLLEVQAQRRALGDTQTALLQLYVDPAEGFGCDFHPNVSTHARLGHELAALIRAELGW